MAQIESDRITRNRKHKRIERTLKVLSIIGTIFALLFFLAVWGYVGKMDLEQQMIDEGRTLQEIR